MGNRARAARRNKNPRQELDGDERYLRHLLPAFHLPMFFFNCRVRSSWAKPAEGVQRASIRPNEDELNPDKKQGGIVTASRWRIDASYAGAGEKKQIRRGRSFVELTGYDDSQQAAALQVTVEMYITRWWRGFHLGDPYLQLPFPADVSLDLIFSEWLKWQSD